VFEGVVMIVLGVLAIVFPVFATLAVALYLGGLFLLCGILALIVMIFTGRILSFWWALVTAILAVVVGLALLLKPAAGIVSLTAVLTAFFIVEGVFQPVAALSHREMIPHSRGWLLVSGIADLVLAAIIISGWPGTVDWTLGLLAGVSLLTSGWTIVMVAMRAQRCGGRGRRHPRALSPKGQNQVPWRRGPLEQLYLRLVLAEVEMTA
jgi:uncharacterized membrane protein HdeD (DUF308 family)